MSDKLHAILETPYVTIKFVATHTDRSTVSVEEKAPELAAHDMGLGRPMAHTIINAANTMLRIELCDSDFESLRRQFADGPAERAVVDSPEVVAVDKPREPEEFDEELTFPDDWRKR